MTFYVELQQGDRRTLSMVASFTEAGKGVRLAYFKPAYLDPIDRTSDATINTINLDVSYDSLVQQLFESQNTGKIPSFNVSGWQFV